MGELRRLSHSWTLGAWIQLQIGSYPWGWLGFLSNPMDPALRPVPGIFSSCQEPRTWGVWRDSAAQLATVGWGWFLNNNQIYTCKGLWERFRDNHGAHSLADMTDIQPSFCQPFSSHTLLHHYFLCMNEKHHRPCRYIWLGTWHGSSPGNSTCIISFTLEHVLKKGH